MLENDHKVDNLIKEGKMAIEKMQIQYKVRQRFNRKIEKKASEIVLAGEKAVEKVMTEAEEEEKWRSKRHADFMSTQAEIYQKQFEESAA